MSIPVARVGVYLPYLGGFKDLVGAVGFVFIATCAFPRKGTVFATFTVGEDMGGKDGG